MNLLKNFIAIKKEAYPFLLYFKQYRLFKLNAWLQHGYRGYFVQYSVVLYCCWISIMFALHDPVIGFIISFIYLNLVDSSACQPTLHKISMLGFHCHILQGEKTLRMHYSNCRLYHLYFLSWFSSRILFVHDCCTFVFSYQFI